VPAIQNPSHGEVRGTSYKNNKAWIFFGATFVLIRPSAHACNPAPVAPSVCLPLRSPIARPRPRRTKGSRSCDSALISCFLCPPPHRRPPVAGSAVAAPARSSPRCSPRTPRAGRDAGRAHLQVAAPTVPAPARRCPRQPPLPSLASLFPCSKQLRGEGDQLVASTHSLPAAG